MVDAPDPALAPGTRVGPYRVEARLGGSAAGTVYAAEHPSSGARVALKVLRRALADDPVAAARFEREARAVGEVRHPGIVSVHALGTLPDGRPYLVMARLEGRSLRAELAARGRLPLGEAWAIARQVAEALGAAHDVGVVHRDLKPDNVFLERPVDGAPPHARVLDFGLAKVDAKAGEELAKLTRTGVPMGTPAYMAPEQWWCQEVSPATDAYALGAMLFELVAGRPPFTAAPFVELVQQHLHEPPPSLAAAGVPAPPAVDAFLARALAKSADDRFASMAELVAAGDAAFAGAPGDEPATRLAAPAASAAAEPARPASLRAFALACAASLALGLAALLAVGYAGPARRDPLEWLHIAGAGALVTLALLPLAAFGLARAARRRATTGEAALSAWWLALLPALSGSITTYGDWQTVTSCVPTWPATERFTTFNLGMYESNAGRFLGQAASLLFCFGLTALPGIGRDGAAPRARVRDREAIAAAVGLALLAVVAVAARAPSGALVAGAAAGVLAIGVALPRRGPASGELERAVASAAAVALATTVGLARVEAREAVLWWASPTRAARAAEVVAASAERTASTMIALAAAAVVVAVEARRLARAGALARRPRPRLATVALALVMLLAAAGDVALHARFQAVRDELRASLARQFSLFAELDPPPGDALATGADAGERFAPHDAAGLQLARRAVAVDAVPTAPLAALESDEGALNVGRDLAHALAGGVARAAPGDPALSIAIDRDVPWAAALRALRVAHKAGARRVELLYTRGPRPVLGAGGPPEASYVVPRDFVAVPVELAEDGFTAAPAARFGDVAPDLARRALAAPGPVRVALP